MPLGPLGFAETIRWMQRSKFCICPPGDVPYNKRYFTALLAGCIPVIFSYPSAVPKERNWWKIRKGPPQKNINPFSSQIDHSQLVVELPVESVDQIKGFLRRLDAVPDAVVVAKQRAIEKVRHLLLYDMSGGREDAFTCMLRELLQVLPDDTRGTGSRRAPLRRPRPMAPQ